MRSLLLSALEALAGLSELEKINAAAATVRASRMYPAAMRFLEVLVELYGKNGLNDGLKIG